MSKKIDRALHGPSWIEVILGAVLSLLLGLVLGAVLLILRPVIVVKELPKEDARDPKSVYFIEGSRDTGKARDAAAKRKAFAAGQSVTVNEDELNSLAGPAATLGAPAPAKAGAAPKAPEKAKTAEKGAPAAETSEELMATGTPNFRLRDGAMQIGVPVTFSVLGMSEKVVVQTNGGFVKQGDVFVYEPNVFYVGSLPLQRMPYLANYARNYFLNAQAIPEDVKTSWAKLASVAVEGNSLKLTMP